MYYVADDPNLTTETVRREVHNGNCELLFTSPEAFVSGSLREKIVAELANQGQLSNLVIDEAHIESWGRHFRVDLPFFHLCGNSYLKLLQ